MISCSRGLCGCIHLKPKVSRLICLVKTPKTGVSSAKGVHLAESTFKGQKQKNTKDVYRVSRETQYKVETQVGVWTNC